MLNEKGGVSKTPPNLWGLPIAQLFQGDVSYQVASDCPRILDALVDHLLLFALIAILFHPQLQNFHPKTIEGRHVLIGKGETDVPIVYARLRLIQENLV